MGCDVRLHHRMGCGITRGSRLSSTKCPRPVIPSRVDTESFPAAVTDPQHQSDETSVTASSVSTSTGAPVQERNPEQHTGQFTSSGDLNEGTATSDQPRLRSRKRYSLRDASGSNGKILDAALALHGPVWARKMTRLAAGHIESVLTELDETAGGATSCCFVLKKKQEGEFETYNRILDSVGDPFQRFVPKCIGCVEVRSQQASPDDQPEAYLRLSNVLYGFEQAFVMDMKLGFRSFAEAECASKKPRPDLFQRMVELCPSEPTDAELAAGAITKYRWMSFRDRKSSSSTLGFRIDGIAGPGQMKLKANVFAEVRDRRQVVQEFLDFLPPPRWRSDVRRKLLPGEVDDSAAASPFVVGEPEVIKRKLRIAELILDQLLELREACETSPFVAQHEFVGTSLLIVADGCKPKARVAIIDFAKTSRLPQDVSIDHRRQWELGNHEDGLLFGLDTCIRCWESVVDVLQGAEPFV